MKSLFLFNLQKEQNYLFIYLMVNFNNLYNGCLCLLFFCLIFRCASSNDIRIRKLASLALICLIYPTEIVCTIHAYLDCISKLYGMNSNLKKFNLNRLHGFLLQVNKHFV